MTDSTTPVVTFDDNFNSLSLWNGTSGTWATNFWYAPEAGNGSTLTSNGEQEWYINSLYAPTASVTPWTVNDGVLTLTAAPASAAVQPLIDGYAYTSGEINTYHSFSQTYGYFQMRAELPQGQGLWPAFWLLPENGSWPPELDVMEVLGSDPSTLYTTAHTDSTGTPTASGAAPDVANTSTQFNTYAVDWTPTTITWYFNGVAVYQVATPADMNSPMYMIANLAVGGDWPGDANATTPLPAQMQVDYIDAYSAMPAVYSYTADGTAGQVLTGAAGIDTFYAGQNSVVMTGGAFQNTYVFQSLPSHAGQITNFDPATDTLDLTALFSAVSYTGTNPVADGTVSFVSDGKGDTQVYFDPHAAGGSSPVLITTLENVAPSAVSYADILWDSPGLASLSAGSSGEILTADDTAGQVLTADADAVFYAGHNSVVMTEDGGTNTFVFQYLPWNAGQITNFNPLADTLDLSALFTAADYTGTNPIADGTLSFVSDGKGDTQVYFNAHDPSNPWPTLIVTLDDISPGALTLADVNWDAPAPASGSSSATTPPVAAPETLTADDTAGQVLTGNTGNDTFYAGHNSVVMTGDGGANSFVFPYLPWNAGQITDFNPATDTLDLTALFAAADYQGSDPVADGYLSLVSDGKGDTEVYFNAHDPSNPWPTLITTLDNVSPSALSASDIVWSGSGSASTDPGPAAPVVGSETLTANDTAGQILTGDAGTDTFYAGHNSVVMNAGAGADTFVFPYLPWNAGQIADFNTVTDKLDLSALFTAADYQGSDPFTDGTLNLVSDGKGDTQIYFNAHDPSNPWPTLITTLDDIAPGAVPDSDLIWNDSPSSPSSSASPTASAIAAETLTGDDTAGQVLTGNPGNDTFYAGYNSVIMTGGAGSDTFVFQYLPWNAGQITNFDTATDKLDLTALFTAANYHGTNPVADGYISFVSDGAGDTQVYFNAHDPSNPWPTLITTLDHVAPASITASDWIYH